MFVKLLFAVDYLAAAALLYFFGEGMNDGSVSASNIGIWTALLLGFGAIIIGGHLLRARGRNVLAGLLLAVPALPAALYGVFVLLIIILQPSWQ